MGAVRSLMAGVAAAGVVMLWVAPPAGGDAMVALSADSVALPKQAIVFTSDRDGNDEIYRMNADGSGQVRLTDNVWQDGEPAFSPNGKRIVFTSDRDGNDEIYRMKVDGSKQIRLTESHASSSPAFAPGGRTIVYQYWRARAGNWDIYRMDADGSNPTNLTREPDAYDDYPAFAPDGKTIVFISNRDDGFDSSDIYRMDTDGSGQTLVRGNLVNELWPGFSSAGRYLVYAVDLPPTDDDAWELFRMGAAGSAAELPLELTSNDSNDLHPSWGGRSASRLTVNARQRSGVLMIRGLLEPATVGNDVTVTLSFRRDGIWTTVKERTVPVRRLQDRDGDSRTDARYRADWDRPGHGRCRVRVTFGGDPYTRASATRTSILL